MINAIKINDDKSKIHDVSEILDVFGKYQVIQYTLICYGLLFITMIDINYVFVAGDLNYRCRIPECEDAGSAVEIPHWWPDATSDRCSKPVLIQNISNGTCSNNSFSELFETCTEWIYESNNTVVGELNLACQPWKANLIGTIHSLGMLVSMLVTGWMSDRFGRKPMLILCVVGSCVGLLKTFATTWYAYVCVEFLEGCMSGGTYTASMVIMLEIVGRKKRMLSGVLFAYFIYLGESIFACIAMFIPYWKNIVRIIYSPPFFFIFFTFFIQESPRWQIVSGNIDEAKETMLLIAKTNKINVSREEIQNLDSAKLRQKFNIKEDEVKEKLRTVFSSKTIIVRLLVTSVCRLTASFVFYGLLINSVWLPGNKYVNFLLTTVMSFPGELISLYLMNRFGRKLPLMIGYIISAALCMGSGYVPNCHTWAKISLFLIGKMIISACYTGCITYTMELLPTSARGSLLGFGSFASRVGGMLAPLTTILNSVSSTLPSNIFGALAVLSGILLLFTPETKHLPLMETVQQVEESVRKACEMKRARKVANGIKNLGYCNETHLTAL